MLIFIRKTLDGGELMGDDKFLTLVNADNKFYDDILLNFNFT